MNIFLLGADRIGKYRLVENVGSWVKVPDNPGKIILFLSPALRPGKIPTKDLSSSYCVTFCKQSDGGKIKDQVREPVFVTFFEGLIGPG